VVRVVLNLCSRYWRFTIRKSPPTINIFNQDPECDLDYCANTARDMKIDVALKNKNNGFGFWRPRHVLNGHSWGVSLQAICAGMQRHGVGWLNRPSHVRVSKYILTCSFACW
jgi:hypothetical protein